MKKKLYIIMISVKRILQMSHRPKVALFLIKTKKAVYVSLLPKSCGIRNEMSSYTLAAYYFLGNTTAKVNENSLGMRYSTFTVQIIVPARPGISRSEPRKVSTFTVADRNAEGTFRSPGKTSRKRECFVRSIETLAPFVPICRK